MLHHALIKIIINKKIHYIMEYVVLFPNERFTEKVRIMHTADFMTEKYGLQVVDFIGYQPKYEESAVQIVCKAYDEAITPTSMPETVKKLFQKKFGKRFNPAMVYFFRPKILDE
jgi:hypothetical protein